MAKKRNEEPEIQPKVFESAKEIYRAIAKLDKRVRELEALDIPTAINNDTGEDDAVVSNIRESILDIFGNKSPEFHEHEHIRLWAGPMYVNMPRHEVVAGTERGRTQTLSPSSTTQMCNQYNINILSLFSRNFRHYIFEV